jgi:hypothetical protein
MDIENNLIAKGIEAKRYHPSIILVIDEDPISILKHLSTYQIFPQIDFHLMTAVLGCLTISNELIMYFTIGRYLSKSSAGEVYVIR